MNSIITANMPNLRSGAKNKVAPEHHGSFAHQNGVFSTNKKRQQEELLNAGGSTRFQIIKEDECQKGFWLHSGFLLLEVQEQKKQSEQHQVRYANLLGRHQSLLLKVSNPKDLVARAMNLPFEAVGEFDGSDVVRNTEKKRKNRVTKFVALTLMQSSFYDGLVREEILKQAKTYFREEVYSPWKIAHCMD
jgi:hypothetical protein